MWLYDRHSPTSSFPMPIRARLNNKYLLQYVEKSARPVKGDIIIRDTKITGFGVRISPGAISFFAQSKMGRISKKRTIGSFPDWSVEQARDEAEKWKIKMRGGEDPLVEKYKKLQESQSELERMRHTFGKAFEEYIELKRDQSADLTNKDRAKVVKKIERTALWNAPLADVGVMVIRDALQPIFAKSPANGWRVYRHCRAAYAWAAPSSGLAGNPFSAWRKERKPKALERRQKILQTEDAAGQAWLKELVRLRADKNSYISITADYLICVLLWGGRKTETQKLKSHDIDFKNQIVEFRSENTKSRRSHFFPLTAWAASILKERIEKNGEIEGDWVFPSRVQGKHIVDIRRVLELLQEASSLQIGAHDLRRTFASELTRDTGANLFIVKVAMNHASISQDVTAGYIDIKTKVDALRPAYEMRERRLMRLAGFDVPELVVNDNLIKLLQSAAANPELKALLRSILQ